MNMKVQCSRSSKALGIGGLLASTCSASAMLDSVIDVIPSYEETRLEQRLKRSTDHKIMPGS